MATVPANDKRPPMGEPGRRRSGASTGGVAESATQGVEDTLQRPGAGPGTRPATGASVPRGDATAQPAPKTRSTEASPADRGDAAMEPHHPEEPRDESAVESFGRAIGEVVTGSDEEDIDPRRPTR